MGQPAGASSERSLSRLQLRSFHTCWTAHNLTLLNRAEYTCQIWQADSALYSDWRLMALNHAVRRGAHPPWAEKPVEALHPERPALHYPK